VKQQNRFEGGKNTQPHLTAERVKSATFARGSGTATPVRARGMGFAPSRRAQAVDLKRDTMTETAAELNLFEIKEERLRADRRDLASLWPIAVLVLGGLVNAAWIVFLGWAFARVVGLL
jgi:hypothetical protein